MMGIFLLFVTSIKLAPLQIKNLPPMERIIAVAEPTKLSIATIAYAQVTSLKIKAYQTIGFRKKAEGIKEY